MALIEFRNLLSFGKDGPWGRIINSFIFAEHPDAVKWQQDKKRVKMMMNYTYRPIYRPIRYYARPRFKMKYYYSSNYFLE